MPWASIQSAVNFRSCCTLPDPCPVYCFFFFTTLPFEFVCLFSVLHNNLNPEFASKPEGFLTKNIYHDVSWLWKVIFIQIIYKTKPPNNYLRMLHKMLIESNQAQNRNTFIKPFHASLTFVQTQTKQSCPVLPKIPHTWFIDMQQLGYKQLLHERLQCVCFKNKKDQRNTCPC